MEGTGKISRGNGAAGENDVAAASVVVEPDSPMVNYTNNGISDISMYETPNAKQSTWLSDSHNESTLSVSLDDDAVQVNITEFFPVHGRMCYRIKTKINLQGFDQKECIVSRNYQDFRWLHDRFQENLDYAGIIIPHLPAQVVWHNVSEKKTAQELHHRTGGIDLAVQDEFQQRARQLERFLKRIALVPNLRTDVNLHVFLTFDEELRPRKPSFFKNMLSGMSKLTATTRLDSDDDYIKMNEWNQHYWRMCNDAYKRCLKLVAKQREFGASQATLVIPFRDLRKMDPVLGTSFDLMSKGFLRAQELTFLKVESLNSLMTFLLGDYIGVSNSIHEMQQRRISLARKAYELKLVKEKTEKNIKSTNNDIQAATDNLEEINKLVEEATVNGLKSFKAAKELRVEEFKEALVALAETEIELAKDCHTKWAVIASELRAM